MNVLGVIILLAIFAVAFYLIATYVTPGLPRTIMLIALGVILLVWLLHVSGIAGGLHARV